MKHLIISSILFFTMIFLVKIATVKLNSFEDSLYNLSIPIETSVKNKEWGKAKKETENLSSFWKEKHNFLTLFLDHRDIELIDYEVTRLFAYIETGSDADAIATIDTIKEIYKTIKHIETFKLSNIF